MHHLPQAAAVNAAAGSPSAVVPFPTNISRATVTAMETFDHTDNFQGATFTATNLRGARFIRADLSAAVMRGVDLAGADIDAPWLAEDGSTLLVNGVDVVPLVEAELNRRFPGRAERRATDPDRLRHAWARLEQAWQQALERAAALPAGAVEVHVDGEWSFTQTLRHLVMATDTWLRKAILEIEQPYHPLGQPNAEFETDGYDLSVFATEPPAYQEVLEARRDRQAIVRNFLATITPEDLDAERRNPWAPDHAVTVRSCLHTILNEEWDHLRYALRDLDAVERGAGGRHTEPVA